MSSAVFSRFSSLTLVGVDDNLKGGDLRRQPEAVFVVTLLDGGGENALDSDAVTAHDHRDFFAVLVEHTGAHRFGILVAEFEDVANFDCRVDAKWLAAVRAGFTRGDAAQVGVARSAESPCRA